MSFNANTLPHKRAEKFQVNDGLVQGLDAHTLRNYSLHNVLRAMIDPMCSAGLEVEVSDAIAKASGKRANGVFIPAQVFARGLTVGTASAGGHTVATDLRADDFISVLRPRSIIGALGAQQLTGLVGNVAIPRATGGASAYWVAENGAPTESQAQFEQVTMSPKTIGAHTDISRKMLLQSSVGAESFVVNDLMNTIAQALDQAALTGTGTSNEPRGLLNASGVQVIALGINGAALSWTDVVGMETAIGALNGFVNEATCGYITNPKVRGKLRQTMKVATYGDTPIWETAKQPKLPGEGMMNGRSAIASTFMPSDLDNGTSTGVCSAMIFGDFSQLIMGVWGAIDINVDRYALSTSGGARIVALLDTDVMIRHPESFVICKDILTA